MLVTANQKDKKMIVGVDPGLSGGVVVVGDNGDIVDAFAMPVIKTVTMSGKSAKRVAPLALWERLAKLKDNYPSEKLVDAIDIFPTGVIENVGMMNSGGWMGCYKLGEATGLARAILDITCGKVYSVLPITWKSKMGLLKKGKAGSIALATELYGSNEHWKLKKHDGIAEAALLAYGHRKGFF